MIILEGTWDYVWMLATIAGAGLFGGLLYELLQVRSTESGTIELPGRRADRRFLDLGFGASLVTGAGAALGIAFFFRPDVQRPVENVTGAQTLVMQWEIVRVIALSIIVGSAGGAFLTALQARVRALLDQEGANIRNNLAAAGTQGVAESAKQTVEQAVTRVVAGGQTTAYTELGGAAAELPPDVTAKLISFVNDPLEIAELTGGREPETLAVRCGRVDAAMNAVAESEIARARQAIDVQAGLVQSMLDAVASGAPRSGKASPSVTVPPFGEGLSHRRPGA